MLAPLQQDAVRRIAVAALQSERQTGCPAELTAAQAIFESGYLTSCPGNNCFGIKADHHGIGVHYSLTSEFLNGEWVKEPLAFESYATLTDCFNDHARLLQVGRYEPAWKQYTIDHDIDRFTRSICPIYATDPDYTSKMLAEIHSTTIQQALQSIKPQ